MEQGIYTNKMEGETRGGVLEDKADNSTMKCSILPEGQAMSNIGYEGGRDVIYQRGYGDHPNTVSMI